MMLLRTLAYLALLVTYPLRFTLYLVHSTVYFTTKPGAALLVPFALVTWGYVLHARGNELLDAIAEATVAFFVGLFQGPTGVFIHEQRAAITAVLAFFLLYWLLPIVTWPIRAIVHALPAPRRPFFPIAPLRIPAHVVRTETARVVVALAGRGFYKGDLASLTARLPRDIQAVLGPRPAETPPAFEPPPHAPESAVAEATPPPAPPPPPAAPRKPEREAAARPPAPDERRRAPPPEARVPGRRPAPPAMPEPEPARDP